MRLITKLQELDNNKEYFVVNRELSKRRVNNVWTRSDNNVKTTSNRIDAWNDPNSRFKIQLQASGKYRIYWSGSQLGSAGWKLTAAPYTLLEFSLLIQDSIYWRLQSSEGFLSSNADSNLIYTGEPNSPTQWFSQFLIYEYDNTSVEKMPSVRELMHNDKIFMICESDSSVVERHPTDGNWITVHPDNTATRTTRTHDVWVETAHFQVKSMPLYYLENHPPAPSYYANYTLDELRSKLADLERDHKIIFKIIADDLQLLRAYLEAALTGFTLYSDVDGGRTLHEAKAGAIANCSRLLKFDEYNANWVWKLLVEGGAEKLYYCPAVIDVMDSTVGLSPGLLKVNYIPKSYPLTGNVAREGHMYRSGSANNYNLMLDGKGNGASDRFTVYRITRN
jgi:hypothetical protein